LEQEGLKKAVIKENVGAIRDGAGSKKSSTLSRTQHNEGRDIIQDAALIRKIESQKQLPAAIFSETEDEACQVRDDDSSFTIN